MPVSLTSHGWVRLPNTCAGTPAMAVATGDTSNRTPLVFGTGVNDTGRISTSTRPGAALTFPDAYSFGEAWELRFTFPESGNSQRQGIFMEVRGSAANSSTIRGMEVSAAQCGAVAIGTLEGANIHAQPRSSSTGNITNLFGVTGEVTSNSACYTGTVTTAAAVRGKLSMEDGATYTNSSIFFAEAEAISSGDVVGSIMRAKSNSCTITATQALDFGCFPLTATCNRVTLIKFKNAAGAAKILRVDNCGTVSVA